ncbi:Ribosomal protein S19e [Carpediemonas membranifera]|uniref:Ribosomal protein S19e n=1 Tax=Carpediemonas membranifera TaxID=201153 RepID=A0A8J6E1U5_9EUKA|nr:Ribosomal protein S19e [Carpediemonas membranifera]|eukprot:KAG9396804.1 Ribosomal protein S19e [Carpediemonas membranifera]
MLVKDVNASRFVKLYAMYLKRSGALELPTWVNLVKTGSHTELAPMDADWYYIRAASIARKVYLNNGIGMGALKSYYGGSINRGVCPCKHRDAAGSIIRHILQQLETKDIIQKCENGGRRITSHGQSDLDRFAATLVSESQ